jgi:hypothetical protein
MPSSVKNKLVSKMNIDQLDDVDSMIDDFLVDDNDYNDDDEYFTAVSNETCISYSSCSCSCSCSSVTASEYTQLSATTYNQDIESEYESLNNKNNIYSNIFFYLSFFDFTKYFN